MANLEENSRVIATTEDQIFLENKNLTTQAELIFGNIVKRAFIVIDKSDSTEERLEVVVNANKMKVNKYITLDYDCMTIVIEFTNGNYVSFRNSEWASMSNVNDIFTGEA